MYIWICIYIYIYIYICVCVRQHELVSQICANSFCNFVTNSTYVYICIFIFTYIYKKICVWQHELFLQSSHELGLYANTCMKNTHILTYMYGNANLFRKSSHELGFSKHVWVSNIITCNIGLLKQKSKKCLFSRTLRLCNSTPSHVWHDVLVMVIWLIYICDMTHAGKTTKIAIEAMALLQKSHRFDCYFCDFFWMSHVTYV